MRELLEHLTRYAGTGSAVVSVPTKIAELGMNWFSSVGLSPLGKYHALMYGRDFYYDCEEAAETLNFRAKVSNYEMITDAYDRYVSNRHEFLKGSLSGS